MYYITTKRILPTHCRLNLIPYVFLTLWLFSVLKQQRDVHLIAEFLETLRAFGCTDEDILIQKYCIFFLLIFFSFFLLISIYFPIMVTGRWEVYCPCNKRGDFGTRLRIRTGGWWYCIIFADLTTDIFLAALFIHRTYHATMCGAQALLAHKYRGKYTVCDYGTEFTFLI